MFYLSKIEHTLPVPPDLLNLPLVDAVKGELEKLFLDKVIANLASASLFMISNPFKVASSSQGKALLHIRFCLD